MSLPEVLDPTQKETVPQGVQARRYCVWPLGERLVVAARGVGDFLVGSPPLYELSQLGGFDRADGPGGSRSVRGVLRHRFHGKIKLMGNLELRARLLPFQVGGQRFVLGGLLFADTGRVWADYRKVELGGVALDDALPSWAVGVGGGLRVQWGETFVVRLDPAWSPTEKTFGLYLDAGHVF